MDILWLFVLKCDHFLISKSGHSAGSSGCFMPDAPKSPMGGEEEPVIPMPTGMPPSDASSCLLSNNEEVHATSDMKPTIPQPSGELSILNMIEEDSCTFSPISTSSRPASQIASFTVTLPLPRRKQSDTTTSLDPIRSRTTSMQSIRDEIIDGLQKMSSNVDFLKRGVAKIYEDFLPTYATPKKQPAHDDHAKALHSKTKLAENPYETVSVCGADDIVVQPLPIHDFSDDSNVTDSKISKDQLDKAFHATFFGIASDVNEVDVEEEEEEEDEGEKTPKISPVPALELPEERKKNDELLPNEEEKKEKALPQSPGSSEEEEDESTTEEVGSDTETLDVSLDIDAHSIPESGVKDEIAEGDRYNELMCKAMGTSWDEVDDSLGLPPPLALHANIRTLKLDLLSSIFQVAFIAIFSFKSCPKNCILACIKMYYFLKINYLNVW